jgi:hypothetical protein
MRARGRGGGQSGAGAGHRQGQVVVDVGAHASQRELDRLDPALRALLDQRSPGQRHRGRVTCVIHCREVQVREGDVELGHERRIGEEPGAQTARGQHRGRVGHGGRADWCLYERVMAVS